MNPTNRKFLTLMLAVACFILIAPAVSGLSAGDIADGIRNFFNDVASFISDMLTLATWALISFIRINPCVYSTNADGSCAPFRVGGMSITLYEDFTVRSFNVALMEFLVAVYILAIVITGLYMIVMVGSPSGRSQGKSMLFELIVGMIFVSMSPILFQIIMDISGALVDQIIAVATADIDAMSNLKMLFIGGLAYFLLGNFMLITAICAVLSGAIRYFVLLIFASLFPVILFMYFFRYTKAMGEAAIKLLFLVIYVQVIQALIIAITAGAVASFSGGMTLIAPLLIIGGFIGLVFSPYILMHLASWVGAATHAYSSRGGAAGTRFIGRLMMGESVGTALTVAAGQYMTAQAMGPHVRSGLRTLEPIMQQGIWDQQGIFTKEELAHAGEPPITAFARRGARGSYRAGDGFVERATGEGEGRAGASLGGGTRSYRYAGPVASEHSGTSLLFVGEPPAERIPKIEVLTTGTVPEAGRVPDGRALTVVGEPGEEEPIPGIPAFRLRGKIPKAGIAEGELVAEEARGEEAERLDLYRIKEAGNLARLRRRTQRQLARFSREREDEMSELLGAYGFREPAPVLKDLTAAQPEERTGIMETIHSMSMAGVETMDEGWKNIRNMKGTTSDRAQVMEEFGRIGFKNPDLALERISGLDSRRAMDVLGRLRASDKPDAELERLVAGAKRQKPGTRGGVEKGAPKQPTAEDAKRATEESKRRTKRG